MTLPSFTGRAEKAFSAWSLRFRSPEQENAFLETYNDYITGQTRVGLILGIGVFLGIGLTDWLFFESGYAGLWGIRVTGALLMLVALLLSFRRDFFHRHGQRLIAVVALVAALGIIGLNMLGSVEVNKAYYTGMLLVVVWSYGMSGLRFINALYVNVAIIALMLAASLFITILPLNWLIVHGLLLLAISAVAGSSAYVIEKQRRLLFLYTRRIDRERRHFEISASQDHLTGLPNRRHFEQRLEERLEEARLEDGHLAVLFLDINRFKPVNDQYGHDAGDRLLKEVANRLTRNVRQHDLVARLAGDEFVVLLSGLTEHSAVRFVAEKLTASIAEPVDVGESDRTLYVEVSASIGIALFPEHDDTSQGLINQADQAMYEAKAAGEGQVRFAG